MASDLKIRLRSFFSVDFARLGLAVFALFAVLVASISVFLNDIYYWRVSSNYLNPYLFLITFIFGLIWKDLSLKACIFLLPLSAGLGIQLNAYLNTNFLILPNAGLDLIAGLFLGFLTVSTFKINLVFLFASRALLGFRKNIEQLIPWPIALMMVMLTASTLLAISRNIYQSAASTSFKGLLFNMVLFRPIGWHDDYMPMSDWIAYALAVAMIVLVIFFLKDRLNKNQVIFRPIMAGLFVASLMGISQAITGVGLPESLLNFRKDQLGYAAIGFQPDLHAFAGHMLLGVIGLWGYFYSGISKLERKLVLVVVAFSWAGLVVSKSRALFFIALFVTFGWFIWGLWRKKRIAAFPMVALSISLFCFLCWIIFQYSNSLDGLPVLSWLGQLANEFKSRDLISWSLLGGIFGSRFEIWEGALRMWSQFPLMGIGQGNFYRLSEIASFSRSNFLILNHGENAHNYFLQTLTETGMLGIFIFIFIFIYPFISGNKKNLLPASIALFALFCGNVFSHSFLVRENLIIGAVFLGLLYVPQNCNQSLRLDANFGSISKIFSVLFTLIFICLSILECFESYNKFPFKKGLFCIQDQGLYEDLWTSGVYEFYIDKVGNAVHVPIDIARPIASGEHISVKLESISSDLANTLSIQGNYYNNGMYLLELPTQHLSSKSNEPIKFRLSISSCFTPRNLGLSEDGRRLGVQLSHPIYY